MPVLLGLLVLLFGLAGLTLWRARRNEAKAKAAYPPLGRMLTVNGRAVHAHVMGAGPDLVLIHGSSGNLRDFTYRMAGPLSARYRVIMFDRPGLGYSDSLSPNGGSLAQQAEILADAAAQLGAANPVVMGHSLGGGVALAWAINHPGRLAALVPVAAVSHPWDTRLGLYYTCLSSRFGRWTVIPLIAAFLSDAGIAAAIASIFAPLAVPIDYAKQIGARLAVQRVALRANALQRRWLLEGITEQAPRYGKITVPTEIIHGRGDETVGHDIHALPLSRDIPGARLTTLETTSHMPHHTDMAAVIAAIDRAAARAGLR